MKNGVDPTGRNVEKPRIVEDAIDRTKPWQLSEIVDPVQCRLVTMPDSTDSSSKVCRLLTVDCMRMGLPFSIKSFVFC